MSNGQELPFDEFLMTTPPEVVRRCPTAVTGIKAQWYFNCPPLRLHCDNERCGGTREFSPADSTTGVSFSEVSNVFLTYTCNNCKETTYIYAIRGTYDGVVVKFGQVPPHAPVVPGRVRSLVKDDWPLLRRGVSCEGRGYGIGAYAYYRRLVDNTWQRLIREIRDVATQEGADNAIIQQLNEAIEMTEFSRAVDHIKDAIPRSLFIEGRNPLTLLYKATSKGLHELTDDQCLSLAGAIRRVLFALAERSAALLKDRAAMKSALGSLLDS